VLLPRGAALCRPAYPYQVLQVGGLSRSSLVRGWRCPEQAAPGQPPLGLAFTWGGLSLGSPVERLGTASLGCKPRGSSQQPHSWLHIVLHPDYRTSEATAPGRGQKIVLACGPAVYHNCWLAYAPPQRCLAGEPVHQ